MVETDVMIRIGAGTILLVLAAGLLRTDHTSKISWYFLFFALGLVGFLANNTPDPALRLSGPAGVFFDILSGHAALFLWLFGLALFDEDFRIGWVEGAVAGIWIALALADRGYLAPAFQGVGLSWALIAIGIGLVAHLLYRILADWRGDLVDARRRRRLGFAGAMVFLLCADLAVDILFGLAWRPIGLTLAQNGAILSATLWWGARLARFDASPLKFVPERPSGTTEDPQAARLLARIERLIREDGVHLDPDLTFAGFSAKVGAPEATVRALIHTRLGHQHFRSFLNAHRLEEAKRRLADPAHGAEKIATIALDSGFASIASFNRVFSLMAGETPSAFRARSQAAANPSTPAQALPASLISFEDRFVGK